MKKNDPMPKQQNKKESKRVHNLIIVDESGSMYVIRKQAFVGMNETLQTARQMQKKYPDQEQRVTLLTFDSGHTTWHYDNAPASRTKNLDWKALQPRWRHTPLRCHRQGYRQGQCSGRRR